MSVELCPRLARHRLTSVGRLSLTGSPAELRCFQEAILLMAGRRVARPQSIAPVDAGRTHPATLSPVDDHTAGRAVGTLNHAADLLDELLPILAQSPVFNAYQRGKVIADYERLIRAVEDLAAPIAAVRSES